VICFSHALCLIYQRMPCVILAVVTAPNRGRAYAQQSHLFMIPCCQPYQACALNPGHQTCDRKRDSMSLCTPGSCVQLLQRCFTRLHCQMGFL
jgi:hypothetical protein